MVTDLERASPDGSLAVKGQARPDGQGRDDDANAGRAPKGGIDDEAERRLLRKLDRNLIPLVIGLFLFCFLDRINIGNARLYGLERDLGLRGDQFQVAVSILFVTYILFEVPSNLVLKRFTPRRWISLIALSWGAIATLSGFVGSYAGLLACRLLLGAAEAGLFPGLTLYLTLFYTKRDFALRMSYLTVGSPVAGALGGLLAWAIGHLDGYRGLSGWRWILILEGVPGMVLGVVAYALMPNDPASAKFLSPEEKALVETRLRRGYGHTASSAEMSREDVFRAFRDWKVWVFCVAHFCGITMLYGFSTFFPTIIRGLGRWGVAQVQLMTIPCYFLGAVVFIAVAFWSDRVQQRGVFVVVFSAVSLVGYAILLSRSSPGVHYFGCFLVAGGLFSAVGLPLAWLTSNIPRYGKRAAASGMQITSGNVSGILAAFIYRTQDAPRYVRGHAVSLGMGGMAAVIYACMTVWLLRENGRREAGVMKEKHRGLSEEELEELGDDSPRYRYTT
ncbi:putative transporter [Escovopsis weberi]|uniref:Putative transporter n=1 Tax=Escovopsis weberi TaxID=150374 RepID=A0A0M8N244_ESCWE|nr:putative transporter [Escovopsis weberi]